MLQFFAGISFCFFHCCIQIANLMPLKIKKTATNVINSGGLEKFNTSKMNKIPKR